MDWIKRHLLLTGAIVALIALTLGVTVSNWVGNVYDDYVRISWNAFTPTTQPGGEETEPTSAPIVVSGPMNINITIGGAPVSTPVVGDSAASSDHHVSDNFFRFLFWLILFGAGVGLVALLFNYLNESRTNTTRRYSLSPIAIFSQILGAIAGYVFTVTKPADSK